MSVTQTHWVIDLLSQNKWNEQKFFESSFQKAQFLQVCVSVLTCSQYYFRGFPLKAVSAPNQIAGWKRETLSPSHSPATCLRAENGQHLPWRSRLARFSFPCCRFSFALTTAQPWPWEPACGVWFGRHRAGFPSCRHWPLEKWRSLHSLPPQFNWDGNLPFFEGLRLNTWGHIPAHCSLTPCTQVSGKCYLPSHPGKCLYTGLQNNEQFI